MSTGIEVERILSRTHSGQTMGLTSSGGASGPAVEDQILSRACATNIMQTTVTLNSTSPPDRSSDGATFPLDIQRATLVDQLLDDQTSAPPRLFNPTPTVVPKTL